MNIERNSSPSKKIVFLPNVLNLETRSVPKVVFPAPRNPEITVSSRISGAYRYVASRKTEISETETRLMQFAKDDLNEALKKVNSFYDEQWAKYQKEMENVKLKYFKEVKSFDIEN